MAGGSAYRRALTAAVLAALVLLCSCEKGLSTDSSSDTGLFIRVTVDDYGSVASTKADDSTEASWTGTTWNEATVTTLYMFIFEPSTDESYSIKYSCVWTSSDASSLTGNSYQITTTENGATVECPYYFIDDDDLVYFIANYDLSSSYSDMTYSNLLSLTTAEISTSTTPYGSSTDSSSDDDTSTSEETSDDDSSDDSTSDDDETTYLACRGPQSSFVMSAVMKGSDISFTDETDNYGNVTKRSFSTSLQRRMAKLCLRIKYKGPDDDSYSQLTDFSSKNISLKCENFARKGALTSDGSYETTAYYASSTDEAGTTTYSSELTTSGDVKSDGGYYTSGETLYDPDSSSDYRAVFYLYPNCWYDESLASSMMTTVPIIESRQTRLSMQITYAKDTAREKDYCYTIPTNSLLPENNDSQSLTSSDYINLYSIQSNHVYNVTVYVQELETGFSVAVSSIAELSSGGTQTIQ